MCYILIKVVKTPLARFSYELLEKTLVRNKLLAEIPSITRTSLQKLKIIVKQESVCPAIQNVAITVRNLFYNKNIQK